MTYEIETIECDWCHDNVPSNETFLNANDEILCNECAYGLVAELKRRNE